MVTKVDQRKRIEKENKPVAATSIKQTSDSGAEKNVFKVPLPISQKPQASSSDGVINLCRLFSYNHLIKIELFVSKLL